MKELIPRDSMSQGDGRRRSGWTWLLVGGCVLVILIALLARREDNSSTERSASSGVRGPANPANSLSRFGRVRRPYVRSTSEPAPTAEEIVAGKLSQFARSRRDIVYAMARKLKVQVPDDVERFFDATEAGRVDELEALYDSLRELRDQDPAPPGLREFMPALLETRGAAQQAQKWPAQKLLDYGDAILGALRPGMVYVGGTDPGRFIPTLLNETGDGERHIIVTQNALADNTYLNYLNFLYGDRMGTLTEEDSQRAFSEYLADAQKRLAHDQQFPNEPKQIRPGEDVHVTDNKVQVSGQIAVMAINERLFQTIMAKNPDLSFAMEESFPFKSTFATATALGPIMELRVQDEQNALTRERAAQSVDYWRETAQQLLADPEAADSRDVQMTYAKMAASQAGLFLEHHHAAEAEQTLRLATEICPGSPEAVFRYVNLLVEQGRIQDALPVAEAAVKAGANNQQQFRSLVEELNRMKNK